MSSHVGWPIWPSIDTAAISSPRCNQGAVVATTVEEGASTMEEIVAGLGVVVLEEETMVARLAGVSEVGTLET